MKYEIIESKKWVNTATGATASIYGAAPYTNDKDRVFWSIEVVGYTIRNNDTGTVGLGRLPFKTMYEAVEHLRKLNIAKHYNNLQSI
jgi:hypothetical protein